MIAESVERRQNFPRAIPVLLISAVMMGVIGLFASVHVALLALIPFGIAIAIRSSRPDPFEIYFDNEGIEVRAPRRGFIPYRRIETLSRHEEDRRAGSGFYPITIVHRDGLLHVPADLTRRSNDVYNFLRDQLPEKRGFSPPAELRPYTRFNDREFGVEHVWSYRCLPDPPPPRNWMPVVVWFALTVVSIVWMVVGSSEDRLEQWQGIGGVLFGVSLLGVVIAMVSTTRKRSNGSIRDGGIVITPAGFALKQGSLCGQMHWDEVSDIRYFAGARHVRVEFDGGNLRLHDDYDRRIKAVYFCLLDHWEEARGYTNPRAI